MKQREGGERNQGGEGGTEEKMGVNEYVGTTLEPPNNGHIGGEHFVPCSEAVPFSEVEMYGKYST